MQIKGLRALAQRLPFLHRPGPWPPFDWCSEQMTQTHGMTPPASASEMSGLPCYVRVTGTLEQRFVAFEFAIGDPELAVELVLLFPQFHAFCAQHQAIQLDAEEGARLDYERLKWRFGAPGIDH